MIWMVALGIVVVTAVVAAVTLLRGRGRPAVVEETPRIERRAARPKAEARPPIPKTTDRRRELHAIVDRQRETVGRMVAGHVQLIDVGAMIADAPASRITPARALDVAEQVAKAMTREGDMIVRMEPDGVAIIYDGLTREQAETRSQEIAEATIEALGELGGEGRYLAEGFAYELDAAMQGAVIDSVDDLIRFVRIAHQSYVNKHRGVAQQLGKALELRSRPVLAANGADVEGVELTVIRRTGDGGRIKFETASWEPVEPALGAEMDCVVLEKLPVVLAETLEGGIKGMVFVPLRLSSLANPLYFDNVRSALGSLPEGLRNKLVPVLDPGQGHARRALSGLARSLAAQVSAVALRAKNPDVDVAAAAEAGIERVVLDAPDARFDDPPAAVRRFLAAAREHGRKPLIFGVGKSGATAATGIARSIIDN
ncbi:MAG: hypothetical protein HQ481_21555 [Alphaproteobacteria bacterium]|nr:hypothetical protein [Alphaproteobacteria bacterium]